MIEPCTIQIKASGGNMSTGEDTWSHRRIKKTAAQIVNLSKTGFRIGVTVGGGNVLRGARITSDFSLDRLDADTIGMMATAMNAIQLRAAIRVLGVKCEICSAAGIPNIETISLEQAITKVAFGTIIIFGYGTGLPYLSTDLAAAVAACTIGAKYYIAGKDGVDGLYSSDPALHSDSTFIPETYMWKVIQDGLHVIDLEAIQVLLKNKIDVLVCSSNDLDSLCKENLKGSLVRAE